MFQLLDQLGHSDARHALREKGEELAAGLMEDEKEASVQPNDFLQFAKPAYLHAVQQRYYYFSCEELLWLSECAGTNVVVAKQEDDGFHLEGYELGHPGSVAVIFLQGGGGQRRQRSHFERLCPEAWISEARAIAAAEAEAAAQLVAEKAAAEKARRSEAMAERRRLIEEAQARKALAAAEATAAAKAAGAASRSSAEDAAAEAAKAAGSADSIDDDAAAEKAKRSEAMAERRRLARERIAKASRRLDDFDR